MENVIAGNVSQLFAGLEDKLSAKICILKFQFPISETGCPTCGYLRAKSKKRETESIRVKKIAG